MRLGITLRPGHEAADAALAERHGCFGVLLDAPAGTESVAAATAAGTTSLTRIIVRLHLGAAHPITLAEEMAVLDNISGGRVVVLADTGELDGPAAAEDLAVLRAGLSARPVRHAGDRWRVPAGLDVHDAPDAVQVTPEPVQTVIPIWLGGASADAVRGDAQHPHDDLAVLAMRPDQADPHLPVQPGRVVLGSPSVASGAVDDIETGRALVTTWADAGTTHLLLDVADPAAALPVMARYLGPEVAMPHFPRVVAEAMSPAPWPRAGGDG